jgi:hypothetical protein
MEAKDSEPAAESQSGKTKLIAGGVLLVLVVGAGLWLVQKRMAGAAQSSAVDQLTALGATIIKTSDGKPNSLILSAPGKDPVDLAKALPLAVALVDLDSLQLSGTTVTDEQLKLVGKMKSLGDLQLAKTSITDEGMKHIAGLSGLTSLYVSGCKVTSDALVEIAKLKALKVLGIDETAISGGFEPLESLEELTLLVAGGLSISAQDADAIVRIPNLRRLDLTDATVSSEALKKLRKKIPAVGGVE